MYTVRFAINSPSCCLPVSRNYPQLPSKKTHDLTVPSLLRAAPLAPSVHLCGSAISSTILPGVVVSSPTLISQQLRLVPSPPRRRFLLPFRSTSPPHPLVRIWLAALSRGGEGNTPSLESPRSGLGGLHRSPRSTDLASTGQNKCDGYAWLGAKHGVPGGAARRLAPTFLGHQAARQRCLLLLLCRLHLRPPLARRRL
ncbi:hypothetical protein E2562_006747 [Oryza meyeriana var. granulata]|uniref:Uncharacterized protein n=1 Tax=Oryza meyeriana var. granulata TaxID=110450 RepID=A0A6G1EGI4_9ORYZ|nr:hypothetical protein E2562_006747 [Oryza meyeriana var. granulata]